jgi:hypothetical protein
LIVYFFIHPSHPQQSIFIWMCMHTLTRLSLQESEWESEIMIDVDILWVLLLFLILMLSHFFFFKKNDMAMTKMWHTTVVCECAVGLQKK